MFGKHICLPCSVEEVDSMGENFSLPSVRVLVPQCPNSGKCSVPSIFSYLLYFAAFSSLFLMLYGSTSGKKSRNTQQN
jgi:hypothetical protein